ncbi:MAG: hypothetical protein A3G49_05990 [Candidatus Sungbacteria bacterium RIFCSPLOWO2_12_FULL_41_11]|uniref:Phosphate transport regulator n=1 Tax=Candidatus Sungbacteria bacterium RIFCSPLOWO2_12_FULL_41_11 TaxID=1802286 RepID=A0A1G2LSZ9_9BACT|nr:MAG: hypothetical protein UV01_C0004G0152 [Parcubacteria group bacterium GW2011_GWA2_42_14]OHA13989.1 MAG: hypothetical protein A3G49_05990 [Candidatus Sungbacteria bacterium RIFCSPLOWO2_12_FULL_41_11]
MFRIIPKEEKFFDLFEKQAKAIKACLPILLEIASNRHIEPLWEKQIQELEQNCDSITKEIIVKAGQTFVTPIDREDIYALAQAIDDVMDFVEEVVIKIVDYKVLPDEALKKFLEIIRLSIIQVYDGIFKLRKLENVDELQIKMKKCEHNADKLVKDIIADSYEISVSDILTQGASEYLSKKELQAVFDSYNHTRQRREIAEKMEEATDACEKVFHNLGNIYLKHA